MAEVFWRSRNSRMTTVRRMICESIVEAEGSVDAEDLLRRVRGKDALISLSTVYRTLGALEECGLLVEVEGGDGKKKYNVAEGPGTATSHVVCEDCGHVMPIENPCLGLRETSAAQAAGFNPRRISLRYEASCRQFRQTGRCDRCDDEGAPPPD